VHSIRKFYSYPIIIADDGPVSEKTLYASLGETCSYYWVGHDKGLSYKRNFLVDKSSSRYVVVIDDDMLWTKTVDLGKAVAILKQGADLVGFQLDDRELYPVRTSIVDNIIHRCKLPQEDTDCPKTDYVLNLFIAKRQMLLQNRWDNDLKLSEHSVFFLRLKQNNVVVRYCKDMLIRHNSRKPGLRPKNYSVMRNRAKDYAPLILKRYNFSKVSYTYLPCVN
jgi:glycosyltransferase involved in cell wall biosynthesis